MRTLSRQTRAPYRPANGADYPRSPFGQALQEIARLAKADVGLEIAFAESNQWDHHVNEGGATGRSPIASATSPTASPRSRRISAIGWRTRSS